VLDEGSIGLTVAVAAVLVGGTLLELLWVRWRFATYFRLAVPLGATLVPLARPPTLEEGSTHSLGFERTDPGTYLFWADRRKRRAPTLLHGVVTLQPEGRRCALTVHWAPPWTPLVAALWLMVLGVVRGEAQVTVPIGALMVFGIVVLYLQGARQAATELRYALGGGAGEGPPDPQG
jgi:hypothetical protein